MFITARQIDQTLARTHLFSPLGLVCLGIMAPLSFASADHPMPTHPVQIEPAAQHVKTESVPGLVYVLSPPVSGIAMSLDSEGHPRALCADPEDSLAPAAMRDAIESDTSRLRHE